MLSFNEHIKDTFDGRAAAVDEEIKVLQAAIEDTVALLMKDKRRRSFSSFLTVANIVVLMLTIVVLVLRIFGII